MYYIMYYNSIMKDKKEVKSFRIYGQDWIAFCKSAKRQKMTPSQLLRKLAIKEAQHDK